MSVLSRVRIVSLLMLCIVAVSTNAVAQRLRDANVPNVIRGAQLYDQGDAERGIAACISCHGPAGNSEIAAYPNLAAMPHEYLAKQLSEFQIRPGADKPVRLGEGGAPSLMTGLVQGLTPEDIQDISLYVATQPLTRRATATRSDWVERGRQIWRGGIPEQGVPACAACHAPNGSGVPALFPRLSGQFPSYMENQLKLFREKSRPSVMMEAIAERLSDADIQAVSDYAAGLR